MIVCGNELKFRPRVPIIKIYKIVPIGLGKSCICSIVSLLSGIITIIIIIIIIVVVVVIVVVVIVIVVVVIVYY